MIKRISSLENFGIYKDFKWGRDSKLQDFNDKNVIYGWNYSGKTTFSRVLMCLKEKRMLEDFLDSKLTIKLENGDEITQLNLDKFNQNVFIFNKDYIDTKLSWNGNKLGEPISFDVGDNTTIRIEIDELNLKIEKLQDRKSSYESSLKEYQEFDLNKFTNYSKNIRLQISNNSIPFDKGDFKRVLKGIQSESDAKKYIVLDNQEIKDLNTSANAVNSLDILNEYRYLFKYYSFYNQALILLDSQPSQDIVIGILNDNKQLYDWVKKGLEFDENQETCSFCGSQIDSTRLELLNQYFSNESQKIRNEIEELINQIDNEIDNVESLSIKYSKNDLLNKLLIPYNKFHEKIQLEIDIYRKHLGFIKTELENKLDGNLFNKMSFSKPIYQTIVFYRLLVSINNVVREHNHFKNNFISERDISRERLKLHLICSFLMEDDYFLKENEYERAIKWIDVYSRLEDKLKREKDIKESSLKTIAKGKVKLESFIQKFLNRSDISIEVTTDDKFNLLRKDKRARNLSEGEKTAIAFSYFLVEYESLGYDGMKESIVFIDDPISSLDSNHISQIYSLINSFFFRKGVDSNKPDSVVNCFKQFFISTHNFEFFSFLRDSNQLKRKKKIERYGEKIEVPACEYYQIRRIDNDNSIISTLPRALSKFKSEYIYLFSIIKQYKDKIDVGGDSYDILIPNALRRFVEIYTLMKIPNEPDSVENRISQLVDDVHNYKTLNHFSHFSTFEKVTKHDELIMLLPEACNELFSLLKQDNKHYLSLLKSI